MIPANALAAVGPQELAKVSTLFTTLKQLRMRLTQVDESVLDKAFEAHVQGVLEKLENRISSLGDRQQLNNIEVVMAKHGLFDAAFQQVILLCQNISPALGDSLKEIRATHSSFMSELQQNVSELVKQEMAFAEVVARAEEQVAYVEQDKMRLIETVEALDLVSILYILRTHETDIY